MKSSFPLLLVPCLVSPALHAGGPAIRGGGTHNLGSVRYRFQARSLIVSSPKTHQVRGLQLKGRLVPADPSKALELDLVVLGGKTLYHLDLVRRSKGIEQERWAATLKTSATAEAPETPGIRDKATFMVSGPLVGIVEGHPSQTTWAGEIWAGFSVERLP